MPKNFVDPRNKYMFLASVIMERENAAMEINSNLKKIAVKSIVLITLDNKWTLASIIIKNFYITMKYLEAGSSDRCKFAPAKPGAVEDSRGPFMTG